MWPGLDGFSTMASLRDSADVFDLGDFGIIGDSVYSLQNLVR